MRLWSWLARLWSQKNSPDSLGNRGEAEAARFLEGLGYRIIERQMHGRFGELDLIAIDGNVIAFVEVKTRSSTAAGHPSEAVNSAKQRRMSHSALAYLKRRGWLERRARFDVVSIIWPAGVHLPKIEHYVNAFEPPGSGQLYS